MMETGKVLFTADELRIKTETRMRARAVCSRYIPYHTCIILSLFFLLKLVSWSMVQDFGKNTMNEIMHAVTEHCRRFPKAFQMSRLACCLSVALFSIFGFFVCLQRYYPILIIDRKYWTNTASAASIFPTTTNKLINKIGETNKGANGHRRDHVAPLIPNYRIDLVYYSENNSTIVYAFVASLWSCLTLFFAFLLSLANDMAYEWRIFHRRRKSHECMAILSLVFCFQTYAGLIINVVLELMVASEIRKISNNNQRPTIFLNLHILCGLLVIHVWHIILKTVLRIHCQEEIRQRAGVVKMLISGA